MLAGEEHTSFFSGVLKLMKSIVVMVQIWARLLNDHKNDPEQYGAVQDLSFNETRSILKTLFSHPLMN